MAATIIIILLLCSPLIVTAGWSIFELRERDSWNVKLKSLEDSSEARKIRSVEDIKQDIKQEKQFYKRMLEILEQIEQRIEENEKSTPEE